MNLAFIASHSKSTYSGGRIHALTLAYAFARLGYEVDYYTNNVPVVLLNDLPDDGAKSRLHFVVNKLFIWNNKRKRYIQVVVVPHTTSKKKALLDRWLFYPFAIKIKEQSKCPLWYLDFEAPNWINESNPTLRDNRTYKYSNKVLKDVDIILSTTKIGQEYAKTYYSQFNANLKFCQLYLCINNKIADTINRDIERKNRIVFFGRFGQKHKNSDFILKILGVMPDDFELTVIGTANRMSAELQENVAHIAEKRKLQINFHSNITDFEKFKILANAKLLIFNSEFEGYGIPPLEAQYMGTPVLCSDIPVLREVNKLADFSKFDANDTIQKDIFNAINNKVDCVALKQYVSGFATYEKFTENLKIIIDQL
jgi:glycosyltransferase involved in cell wall biosynthesis